MENRFKVVFDTNILISGIFFGGIPRQLFQLCKLKQIQGVTSLILIAELCEVLSKKFSYDEFRLEFYHKNMLKIFEVVQPMCEIHASRHEPDNRVLEVAVESSADFIVTGDKDLLDLGTYRKIKIINPKKLLEKLN